MTARSVTRCAHSAQALKRILSPRHYEGRIFFLPHHSDPASLEAGREATASEALSLEGLASRARGAAAAAGGSGGGDGGGGSGGAWRVFEGPFEGLWAMNLAWGSETVCPAPRAAAADGAVDLVIVKRPNRGRAHLAACLSATSRCARAASSAPATRPV